MKKLNFKLLTAALIILSALLLTAGCSSGGSPAAAPPASSPVNVQAMADPIMENILVSLKNNDYAAFSKDFSQTVKNTLNQTAFKQLYSQMQTAVGDYQSRAFFSSTVQNGVITAVYIAKYSGEPAGVSVTLVLKAANGGYEVQGLNFNSPNLSGHPLDVTELRAYADPETENLLVSINNNDYAGFSKDLDPAMKNAIPQKGFGQLYDRIKSAAGDYQSKEFESASEQNNIITALYLARYTDEPSGVWVSVSFDSSQQVAGLHFNSPKLRQAQ